MYSKVWPGRNNEPIGIYASGAGQTCPVGACDFTPQPGVCDLDIDLVAGESGVVVFDGARELADLPVLHPHGGLRPPLADGRAVDLPTHNPISCATISRFQVASPKVTSELLARLK